MFWLSWLHGAYPELGEGSCPAGWKRPGRLRGPQALPMGMEVCVGQPDGTGWPRHQALAEVPELGN